MSDRRFCRRILLIQKIFNNKTPYLRKQLPLNCRPLFGGSIRNSFREIMCKSNRYRNNFFPDAIVSWTIFSKHFDDVPSFNTFKDYINTFFRPKPKSIFGVLLVFVILCVVTKGVFTLLTPQLISVTNVAIGDTSRFLYSTQRATLLTIATEILQQNDLHKLRNRSMNYSDNKKILLSKIRYIKDTQRFNIQMIASFPTPTPPPRPYPSDLFVHLLNIYFLSFIFIRMSVCVKLFLYV